MAVVNLNLPQLEPNLHVILMIIQAKKWRTNSKMLPGPIMSKKLSFSETMEESE